MSDSQSNQETCSSQEASRAPKIQWNGHCCHHNIERKKWFVQTSHRQIHQGQLQGLWQLRHPHQARPQEKCRYRWNSFAQPKGTGASGSFKLVKKAVEPKKKKPVAKKPAASAAAKKTTPKEEGSTQKEGTLQRKPLPNLPQRRKLLSPRSPPRNQHPQRKPQQRNQLPRKLPRNQQQRKQSRKTPTRRSQQQQRSKFHHHHLVLLDYYHNGYFYSHKSFKKQSSNCVKLSLPQHIPSTIPHFSDTKISLKFSPGKQITSAYVICVVQQTWVEVHKHLSTSFLPKRYNKRK